MEVAGTSRSPQGGGAEDDRDRSLQRKRGVEGKRVELARAVAVSVAVAIGGAEAVAVGRNFRGPRAGRGDLLPVPQLKQ